MTFKLIIGKLTEADLSNDRVIALDSFVKEIINNKNTNCKIQNQPFLDSIKRNETSIYLNNLSEKIISELKFKLNSLNKVNYGTDDWKIIVGPWLNNFLKISHNRFYKIKRVLSENDISEVTAFNYKDENFTLIDNLQLNEVSNNVEWNAIMYSKIISFLKPNINIMFENLNTNFSRTKKISIKSIFKNFISFLLSFLIKKNDALIVHPYLPYFENIKLNFFLKQFPQSWRLFKLVDKKYDIELRKKIILKNSENDFEMFMSKIIPSSLPICHIESFNKLKTIIDNSHLPKNPKFIFTSNNYEYDEVFKLYVVLKKKNKSTYIVGQHGSYISSIENMFFKESHAADYYLDWGKNGFDSNQDGFNLKLINKSIKNDKNGKILILDSPYGTNNKTFNRMDENIIKEKFLHTLISSIDKDLHKNIILKLHTSYKQRDKTYLSKIKSICPDIKIETDNKIIFKLFKKARCVIHTYDSTGIYETMTFNIPTFCIWPNELNHVQQKYQQYYNILKKNNVLFFEPKYLAEKINSFYSNLDMWWLKTETKEAINIFLNQFSNIPNNNSTKVLAKKLIELSRPR